MNKFLASFILVGVGFSTYADCGNLKDCTKEAYKLMGKNFITSEKLEGKIESSEKFNLTKENAQKIISAMLNQNGFTRINIDSESDYIINARDIRYNTQNTIQWSGDLEKIPDLSDYFLLQIKVKNPELMQNTVRSLRPFLSRYGRIVEQLSTSSIIIQDTGINLRKVAALVAELDRPVDPKILKLLTERKNECHEKDDKKIKKESKKHNKEVYYRIKNLDNKKQV